MLRNETHWLGNTLDVVTENLAVTFSSAPEQVKLGMPSTQNRTSGAEQPSHSLSETLSTFAASRHISVRRNE